MRKAAKIAISLPQELLRVAEQARKRRGESRSQFFRRAAESLLHRGIERKAEARYVSGYREHPEDAAEMRDAERISLETLANEPWERDEARFGGPSCRRPRYRGRAQPVCLSSPRTLFRARPPHPNSGGRAGCQMREWSGRQSMTSGASAEGCGIVAAGAKLTRVAD